MRQVHKESDHVRNKSFIDNTEPTTDCNIQQTAVPVRVTVHVTVHITVRVTVRVIVRVTVRGTVRVVCSTTG